MSINKWFIKEISKCIASFLLVISLIILLVYKCSALNLHECLNNKLYEVIKVNDSVSVGVDKFKNPKVIYHTDSCKFVETFVKLNKRELDYLADRVKHNRVWKTNVIFIESEKKGVFVIKSYLMREYWNE